MKIVYDSLSGQSKKFAASLGYEIVEVGQELDDYCVLITRSFGFGKVPITTTHFLQKYSHLVVAVAVSGNKNWGSNYGKAGETIEQDYGIPLILKFEASGFENDRELVRNWIKEWRNQNDDKKL